MRVGYELVKLGILKSDFVSIINDLTIMNLYRKNESVLNLTLYHSLFLPYINKNIFPEIKKNEHLFTRFIRFIF